MSVASGAAINKTLYLVTDNISPGEVHHLEVGVEAVELLLVTLSVCLSDGRQ